MQHSPAKKQPTTALDSRNRHAFTITEVAVVAVILGILLSSILALVSHSARYLHDIRLAARAAQVLQQKIEDIRILQWENSNSNIVCLTRYPLLWTNSESTYCTNVITITTNRYDSYSGTTTVLRVTLTTTWTNFSSRRIETNRLTTLVTNRGINNQHF